MALTMREFLNGLGNSASDLSVLLMQYAAYRDERDDREFYRKQREKEFGQELKLYEDITVPQAAATLEATRESTKSSRDYGTYMRTLTDAEKGEIERATNIQDLREEVSRVLTEKIDAEKSQNPDRITTANEAYSRVTAKLLTFTQMGYDYGDTRNKKKLEELQIAVGITTTLSSTGNHLATLSPEAQAEWLDRPEAKVSDLLRKITLLPDNSKAEAATKAKLMEDILAARRSFIATRTDIYKSGVPWNDAIEVARDYYKDMPGYQKKEIRNLETKARTLQKRGEIDPRIQPIDWAFERFYKQESDRVFEFSGRLATELHNFVPETQFIFKEVMESMGLPMTEGIGDFSPLDMTNKEAYGRNEPKLSRFLRPQPEGRMTPWGRRVEGGWRDPWAEEVLASIGRGAKAVGRGIKRSMYPPLPAKRDPRTGLPLNENPYR